MTNNNDNNMTISTKALSFKDLFSHTHKKVHDNLRNDEVVMTKEDMEYLNRATTFYSEALFKKYGNQLISDFQKVVNA